MTANVATTADCPVCRSNSSYLLAKDGCPYFECTQCGFLFHRAGSERPAAAAHQFYDSSYWEMERNEAARREKEDGFVRAIELLYLSSIRVENVLDFGCGLGITVQMLRDKLGLNAIGVDVSAEFAGNEYLHRCDLADLSAKYPPAYFDAIYSIEVFEHLENPAPILAALHALLKPEGKILINTGTREYLDKYDRELNYVDPLRRGHISIYSLKSLQHLAGALGRTAEFLGDRKYEVIVASAAVQEGPNPENLERTRRLGEYFPALFGEYMRLVYVEREFETRSIWALQLLKMVETLSPGTRQALAEKPLWKKLWTRASRR